jgi:RND family efflux transporter MFP subunit
MIKNPQQYLLFTAIFCTAIFSCSDNNVVEETSEVIRPAKIVTTESAGGGIHRTFPALVAANESTNLAFRVAGQIKKRYVNEGQKVLKGTLIAELDPTDFKIQYDDAMAKYELAKSQHNRIKPLIGNNLASQADLDKSRSEMLRSQAQLDKASQELKYTKIYSPYDGVIAQVKSENFDHVAKAQPIVEFQNDSVSDIQFDLPEKLLKRFDGNNLDKLKVQVFIDSYPELSFKPTFKEMRKTTSTGGLSFKVTLSVVVPDKLRVLPGMSATVKTLLVAEEGDEKHVLIPIGAIFSQETTSLSENKEFVWVVDENSQTHLREINVVRLLSTGAVVDSGLNIGDRVIAAGTSHIYENQTVKPLLRERGL